jgi:hypothetical protein
VSIDQLTTLPSKQSIVGDRYTLPAGVWNSVMSVRHVAFGTLALTSRFTTLSGAGPLARMYEPYRRRLLVAATRHSGFIRRRTTFSEMFTD